jgi:hypothetical protein
LLVGVEAYVESGVGGHADNSVQAWVYDIASWGICGQGLDESEALDGLSRQVHSRNFRVTERISGDEQTFSRDERLASADERHATLNILRAARGETCRLVASLSDAELDFIDPERTLPDWATWTSLRQMAWHLADTESRYYLAQLGVAPPPRRPTLLAELESSHEHVVGAVATVAGDLSTRPGRERWTTTKVLRRLAWHERSELVTMRRLADRARRLVGR